MSEDSALQRKLIREKAARQEAEQLLEQKSLELYRLNQKLSVALTHLELKSEHDISKLEFNHQVDQALIQFGSAFLSHTLDDRLLNRLLDRLRHASVILRAGLSLNSGLLNSIRSSWFGDSMPQWEIHHFHLVCWHDNFLSLPLLVDGESVGALLLEVEHGMVEREYIEEQMLLVRDLLASALTRQIRAEETIDARQRAEASERATKEFVAMINHELRTPLNGLLGNAELLASTSLDSHQQQFLSNLVHSGELLRVIINDLLDFSKISAGVMALIVAPFDWHDLERIMLGIFTPKATEKAIQFVIEQRTVIPQCLMGDQERISQILVNLIGNAIKFTHTGMVKLVVSYTDEGLEFQVQDTGVGIPSSALATLFDPFVQADRSTKRHYEGSGLGLAICHNLVSLMKGQLDCQSVENVGSTFRVLLPLRRGSKPVKRNNKSGQLNERLKPLSELKVLVVDDIRMNQIIVQEMLKKFGITPDTSYTGLEALQAVEGDRYDLIFMDCRMPEMDGFEATERLRSLGYGMPIIAITAGTTLEERKRCIVCGMNDILTKPYTAADLEKMIRKWVR